VHDDGAAISVRGHRTLVIAREGGKVVTILVAPRVIGVAPGERCCCGLPGTWAGSVPV